MSAHWIAPGPGAPLGIASVLWEENSSVPGRDEHRRIHHIWKRLWSFWEQKIIQTTLGEHFIGSKGFSYFLVDFQAIISDKMVLSPCRDKEIKTQAICRVGLPWLVFRLAASKLQAHSTLPHYKPHPTPKGHQKFVFTNSQEALEPETSKVPRNSTKRVLAQPTLVGSRLNVYGFSQTQPCAHNKLYLYRVAPSQSSKSARLNHFRSLIQLGCCPGLH